MITKIEIENFKAIREVNLPLAPLNIFTGLNGMGKSTILQALMLLRQSIITKSGKLNFKGKLVNIGTFLDAFCEYATSSQELKLKIYDEKEALFLSKKYDSELSGATEVKHNSIDYRELEECSLFSDDSFMYLSAHRISPQDAYSTDDSKIEVKQFGNNGEFAPHYYHLHKSTNIPIKELAFSEHDKTFTLREQVDKWMSVISPKIMVKTEISHNQIYLKYAYKTTLGTTNDFNTKNAGFGLTYVFAVLVAILSAKPGDILIIENPESHIHPKGQTELARLMALAAKNGVQIFCETHSDHIIYGSRIAIKEQDIAKEDVRLYYIDRDNEEHFSLVHKIEIDEHGRMAREVRQYFDEFESHLNRLM